MNTNDKEQTKLTYEELAIIKEAIKLLKWVSCDCGLTSKHKLSKIVDLHIKISKMKEEMKG